MGLNRRVAEPAFHRHHIPVPRQNPHLFVINLEREPRLEQLAIITITTNKHARVVHADQIRVDTHEVREVCADNVPTTRSDRVVEVATGFELIRGSCAGRIKPRQDPKRFLGPHSRVLEWRTDHVHIRRQVRHRGHVRCGPPRYQTSASRVRTGRKWTRRTLVRHTSFEVLFVIAIGRRRPSLGIHTVSGIPLEDKIGARQRVTGKTGHLECTRVPGATSYRRIFSRHIRFHPKVVTEVSVKKVVGQSCVDSAISLGPVSVVGRDTRPKTFSQTTFLCGVSRQIASHIRRNWKTTAQGTALTVARANTQYDARAGQ